MSFLTIRGIGLVVGAALLFYVWHSTRARRVPRASNVTVVSYVVLVLLVLLVGTITSNLLSLDYHLSPQSRKMMSVGGMDDLIELYRRTGAQPPGYPLFLNLFHRLGIPLRAANAFLACVSVALIFFASCRALRNIDPIIPTLCYSLLAANIWNYTQFTSEVLLIPLTLVAFIGMTFYVRNHTSAAALLAISSAISYATISRWQALFWLWPLGMLSVAVVLKRNVRLLLQHAGVYSVVTLLPVSFLFAVNYYFTGYVTRKNRFAERRLPEHLQHYRELIQFDDNILRTTKTILIDFFSAKTIATHGALNANFAPSFLETLAIVLASVLLLACAARVICRICHVSRWQRYALCFRSLRRPSALITLFVSWYLFVLIALWSTGNNDPIYTRFVCPVYPFLLLWISTIVDRSVPRQGLRTEAVLGTVTLALLVAINLDKLLILNRLLGHLP